LVKHRGATDIASPLGNRFFADYLGKARSFEDVRDHATIRVLTDGVRRTELAQMEVSR
jgi:hypothetical protein